METKQRFPPHLEIANGAIPTFPQVLPRLSYERKQNNRLAPPGLAGNNLPELGQAGYNNFCPYVLFPLAGFDVTIIGRF